MNNRIAVVVLAGVVASPAFAQSHDPSIGSGNRDRSVIQPRSATVSRAQPMRQQLTSRTTLPHMHETRK